MLETKSQATKPRPNPKDCFLWEQKVETSDGEEYEGDDDKSQDFYSVEQHDEKSQGFYSVNSRFSRCSLSEKEFNHSNNFGAPSVLKEFGHCKGWPFGLSRRPPLLNCPSDSWIWRKRNLGSKMRASTFTSQRFAISHEMLQENTNRFK